MAEKGLTAPMSTGQLPVERTLELRLNIGGQRAPQGQTGHVVLQGHDHEVVDVRFVWSVVDHGNDAA